MNGKHQLYNLVSPLATVALALFGLTVALIQSAQAQNLATRTPWTESVLQNFSYGAGGSFPTGTLIFDAVGNLYGTTDLGGSHDTGTIFELTPAVDGGWMETVLYSFDWGMDYLGPAGGLVFDSKGNLYGTTVKGGTYGLGTAFELTPALGGGWTEQVLHSFGNGTDGWDPFTALIWDVAGNLYGTTFYGGSYGYGTAFELTPAVGGGWTEQVLHSFGNGTDGAALNYGMTFDAAGNLYGTTVWGGTYGHGTVFELTPTVGGGWTETVLHSFGNASDGMNPSAGLVLDAAGNLYGTTPGGGTYGSGTVFELTPMAGGGWTEQVLHNFEYGDGSVPICSLIFDAAGNLYGTTQGGGTNNPGGTVFELTPSTSGGWTETVLHNFGNGTDGATPQYGLVFDKTGSLYGTTDAGGTGGLGTVFKLTPVRVCAKCSPGVLR